VIFLGRKRKFFNRLQEGSNVVKKERFSFDTYSNCNHIFHENTGRDTVEERHLQRLRDAAEARGKERGRSLTRQVGGKSEPSPLELQSPIAPKSLQHYSPVLPSLGSGKVVLLGRVRGKDIHETTPALSVFMETACGGGREIDGMGMLGMERGREWNEGRDIDEGRSKGISKGVATGTWDRRDIKMSVSSDENTFKIDQYGRRYSDREQGVSEREREREEERERGGGAGRVRQKWTGEVNAVGIDGEGHGNQKKRRQCVWDTGQEVLDTGGSHRDERGRRESVREREREYDRPFRRPRLSSRHLSPHSFTKKL
jgi:hypothetical protein